MLLKRKKDKAMMAILATPAPTPMPALAPVLRPLLGCWAGNLTAKTTFRTAEVGFPPLEGEVVEVVAAAVILGAAA
jgi:hypothetical protein